MKWVIVSVVLVAFGSVLRRLMRLDGDPSPLFRKFPFAPLGATREAVYRPVALELETHAAIVGISLNEAFEERDTGNLDLAWHLIRLTASEWARMASILNVLLATMSKYMPTVQITGPARSMDASHFKSQIMLDFAPRHEMLAQLVFRSRPRFHVNIRGLRRASEALTADYRRMCRTGEKPEHRTTELWKALDLEFHDFDLITKQVLITLRSLLAGLPDSEVSEFAAELTASLPRGMRSNTWDLANDQAPSAGG
jgi:hypothetical protein